MNRQEKAQIIEQLHEKVSRASIAVVTDFKGLTVEELTKLRAKCYEVGVDYQVVKNTLARLALNDTDHGALSEHLKENCAIALGYEDPVALAKTLADYAKTSKKFAIRFGTMQAVPRNFVCLFANIERKFLYALTAIKEQKEAA